ncbi:MAG TPA: UDP-2,3-diacylglucosamine diphosphatase [Xanthomonadales bacterium]|nr:UDP-2,3-diacylglucosamine diphosphatase [Xanthomonadales bacterium]
MMANQNMRHFRSVFISDVHLGYKGCNANLLADFLKHTRTQNLFLVGDIVDMISLRRTFYWPQAHNNVIRMLLGKAKHDTRVVYIPGNHDFPFREYCGLRFGNLEIRRRCRYTAADGRKYLVTHGDDYDGQVRFSLGLKLVGYAFYEVIMRLNRSITAVRDQMGKDYWSLATFLKEKSGSAKKYVDRYREAAMADARHHELDGVICGHIHRPEITVIDGIRYLNDGDWVESCSVLVEHSDGEMELLHWPTEVRKRETQVVLPAAA